MQIIIFEERYTHFPYRYLDSTDRGHEPFFPLLILFRDVSAPILGDLIKKVWKVNRVATRGEKNLPPPPLLQKSKRRKSWPVGKLSVGIPWTRTFPRPTLSIIHLVFGEVRGEGERKNRSKRFSLFRSHRMMNQPGDVIIFLGWKSFIAIICIYIRTYICIYMYIRGKEGLVNTNGRSFNFQVMQLLPGNNIYRRILNHGRHVHSALMHDTRWKYFDDVIGFPDKLHRPRIHSDRTWEPRVIIYFGRNDSCPHHSSNPRSTDRLNMVTIPGNSVYHQSLSL